MSLSFGLFPVHVLDIPVCSKHLTVKVDECSFGHSWQFPLPVQGSECVQKCFEKNFKKITHEPKWV